VKLLFLLDCFETLAQFGSSILPLCPQIVPYGIRDFPRSKQPRHPRFFFVNSFQCGFNPQLFVRFQVSQLLRGRL